MTQDTVKEGKAIVPEDGVNKEVENDEATQNNDFYFTNDGFVEYCKELNDTTRHHGNYREVYNIIKGP